MIREGDSVNRDTPIIAVTANAMKGDLDKVLPFLSSQAIRITFSLLTFSLSVLISFTLCCLLSEYLFLSHSLSNRQSISISHGYQSYCKHPPLSIYLFQP